MKLTFCFWDAYTSPKNTIYSHHGTCTQPTVDTFNVEYCHNSKFIIHKDGQVLCHSQRALYWLTSVYPVCYYTYKKWVMMISTFMLTWKSKLRLTQWASLIAIHEKEYLFLWWNGASPQQTLPSAGWLVSSWWPASSWHHLEVHTLQFTAHFSSSRAFSVPCAVTLHQVEGISRHTSTRSAVSHSPVIWAFF